MEDNDNYNKLKESLETKSSLFIYVSIISNIIIITIYQFMKYKMSLPFNIELIALFATICLLHFTLFAKQSKTSIKFISILPWFVFFFLVLIFKFGILDSIKAPFANTFGYPIATAIYGLSSKLKNDWLCNPDLVPSTGFEGNTDKTLGGSDQNTTNNNNNNVCAEMKDPSVANLLRKIFAKPEIYLSTIGTSSDSKDKFLAAFEKSGLLKSTVDFSSVRTTIDSWFTLRDNIAQLVWLLLVGCLSGLVALEVISSNESIKSLSQYISNDEQRSQLYKDYNTLDDSQENNNTNVESNIESNNEPEGASPQIFS